MMLYDSTRVMSMHKNHNRDLASAILDETGFDTSSFIIITHVPSLDIAIHEEIPRYTLIRFISDAGGILGVFLGFSFWSLHSSIVAPIVAKLEQSLLGKVRKITHRARKISSSLIKPMTEVF